MSALEEPSPKTSQPLTPCCRPAAPARRLLHPTASYCPARHSGAYEVEFHRESQNRPTVPSFEGNLSRAGWSVTRRWRNDSGCLRLCQLHLRALTRSCSISATQTQRLATPDRATHHAASVTIWRDACAPVCSDASLTQRLCGAYEHCSRPTTPPAPTHPFEDEPPSPASAVSTVGYRLGRPPSACLATCREARPRCVLTNLCFPTTSTTSTRALSVPSFSSKLSLRP
jgi:hypothetical protein